MRIFLCLGNSGLRLAMLMYTDFWNWQEEKELRKFMYTAFWTDAMFLIHNSPGAHIQMTYLRIAHLPVRKPYRKSAGIASDKRISAPGVLVDNDGLVTELVP